MTQAKSRGARRSKVAGKSEQAVRYRVKKQAAGERVRTAPNGLEALLSEYEYAAITGESVSTARMNRLLGKGCPFVKLGALVRYRPDDIRAYIEQNLRPTTTAAPVPASMPGAIDSVNVSGGAAA